MCDIPVSETGWRFVSIEMVFHLPFEIPIRSEVIQLQNI